MTSCRGLTLALVLSLSFVSCQGGTAFRDRANKNTVMKRPEDVVAAFRMYVRRGQYQSAAHLWDFDAPRENAVRGSREEELASWRIQRDRWRDYEIGGTVYLGSNRAGVWLKRPGISEGPGYFLRRTEKGWKITGYLAEVP